MTRSPASIGKKDPKAEKRKRRAAKRRGKALEEWVIEYHNGIEGVTARKEKKGAIWEKATDVLIDVDGGGKHLHECKNRAEWLLRSEIFEWLEQAEGDAERFDEIRWPAVVHCNSPGKGVKRDPVVIQRYRYFRELIEHDAWQAKRIAFLESEVARLEEMIESIDRDADYFRDLIQALRGSNGLE